MMMMMTTMMMTMTTTMTTMMMRLSVNGQAKKPSAADVADARKSLLIARAKCTPDQQPEVFYIDIDIDIDRYR